jgi:hypothetical protein
MYYEAAIDIQRQIVFVSALLCGFSLAFLIGLVQMNKPGRLMNACLITTGLAASSLLVSTITGVAGIFWLAERPQLVNDTQRIDYPELLAAYRWSLTSLLLGILALFGCLGLVGWLKSRLVGWILMVLSFISVISIFMVVIGRMGLD